MRGERQHRRAWLVVLSVAFLPVHSWAWGPLAHQLIYRASIERLRASPFRQWLERNVETGTRQSMTPDIDWKPFDMEGLSLPQQERVAQIGPGERATHFFDRDLLLPRDGAHSQALSSTGHYREALPILRRILRATPQTAALADKPWEHGSVPWRTAQLWTLLVDALKRRDFEKAQLYAAALTHYAAESTNAFHSDSRYDGIPSLTKGPGLHLAYEMHGYEAAMEKRGAKRPSIRTGVWEVPSSLVKLVAEGPKYLSIAHPQGAVAFALANGSGAGAAVAPISSAYGATPVGASGTPDMTLFFSMPLSFPGFNGTVGQHADQQVALAASFASSLLEGAYLAASAESLAGIPFPTQPIGFDRGYAVDNYPTPPTESPPTLFSRPSPPLVHLPTCFARLADLATRLR